MYFQYLSDKQASIPFIINFNVFVLHATLVSVKKRDIGFVFLLTFIYFPTTINQSLLFLLNAPCLAEKQQIPVL
jgi:mannitol/fructose-specific phosphotransferase system IIA component (Ntr-type)